MFGRRTFCMRFIQVLLNLINEIKINKDFLGSITNNIKINPIWYKDLFDLNDDIVPHGHLDPFFKLRGLFKYKIKIKNSVVEWNIHFNIWNHITCLGGV